MFRILFEIFVYSESILKIQTGPSAMKEDHYILGAGGQTENYPDPEVQKMSITF